MLTFKEMRFEVTQSGGVYMTLRNPSAEGARYGAYFLWTSEEWDALVRPRQGSPRVFGDAYHLCDASWPGMLTFIDTEAVSEVRSLGTATVAVYRMEVDPAALRIIDERIRQAMTEAQNGERWHDGTLKRCAAIEVSTEDRAHWLAFYGRGKGSARIEFTSSEVKNKFESYLSDYRAIEGWDGEGDEPAAMKAKRTFERSLATLKAIAKNTTAKATDVGVLLLGPDWEGFSFSVGSLYGGLIFHASSGEWSVHT